MFLDSICRSKLVFSSIIGQYTSNKLLQEYRILINMKKLGLGEATNDYFHDSIQSPSFYGESPPKRRSIKQAF